MKIGIAVLSDVQKMEIENGRIDSHSIIQWVDSTEALLQIKDADFWVDCTFCGNEIPHFEKPTLVHAPALSLANCKSGSNIGRFCAWSTFLSRKTWEISAAEQTDGEWIDQLMKLLGRKFLLVKDEIGLVSPRIVCTIINEAYYALQAGISSAEEIDVAMKLGTNYPYGPLEWANRIGLSHVYSLLKVLSERNSIYQPAFYIK